jgi:hypothetical protein
VTTDLREVTKTDLHGAALLDDEGNPITEMVPDPYFKKRRIFRKKNGPKTAS